MQQNQLDDLQTIFENLFDSNGLYWKFTQYIEFQEEIIKNLCKSLKEICEVGNNISTIEELANKLSEILKETQEIVRNYISMKSIFEKEIKDGGNNTESKRSVS